jgi:Flp pilus assembly pilin Flp
MEYAILVGVVAVGIGAAVSAFLTEIQDGITDLGSTVDQASELN